jgi:ribosomal protein L37AE/L43A
MQADPMAEWQRLTQQYREMYDGELEELAADKAGLTEVAQQVLRDELRKRGLDKLNKLNKPSGPEAEANPSERFATPQWTSHGDWPESEEAAEEGAPPVEYTWKTFLCECDGPEKSWQIQEVLRQAGIESWIERPGYYEAPGIGDRQIVVAADQLEKACAILAKPIPKEIIEQSEMEIPDYEPPVCPGCGAKEPVLESADPVNTWRCERCGKQWTEQAEEGDSEEHPKSTHTVREEENPFTPGPLSIL